MKQREIWFNGRWSGMPCHAMGWVMYLGAGIWLFASYQVWPLVDGRLALEVPFGIVQLAAMIWWDYVGWIHSPPRRKRKIRPD